MLLLLSGCLLLAKAPDGVHCDDADCSPYRCSDYGDECEDFCSGDDECANGFICALSSCEEPCVDADCPNGFLCEDVLNECDDMCFSDNDCQPGWDCCLSFDECPDYAECYRP
jgi:hypothetical protein